MKMKYLCVILVTAGVLAGCAKQGQLPAAPGTAAVKTPTLSPTFGRILKGADHTWSLHYKDIHILVDPAQVLRPDVFIDYILLSDSKSVHFSAAAQIRKKTKILTTEQNASAVRALGFNQVKTLGEGSRILLQKEKDFLFVAAVPSYDPVADVDVNSYFLEWDNGRNIFLAGDLESTAVVQNFVYALRDDGKEVHAAFFNNQSFDTLVQMIAMLQPRDAWVSNPDVDLARLRIQLKEELFDGFVGVIKQDSEAVF